MAAGKALDIPLIVTEHYPDKLGPIVKDLDVSHAVGIYKKTLFSMTTQEVRDKIEQIKKERDLKTIILFGLEVCKSYCITIKFLIINKFYFSLIYVSNKLL